MKFKELITKIEDGSLMLTLDYNKTDTIELSLNDCVITNGLVDCVITRELDTIEIVVDINDVVYSSVLYLDDILSIVTAHQAIRKYIGRREELLRTDKIDLLLGDRK